MDTSRVTPIWGQTSTRWPVVQDVAKSLMSNLARLDSSSMIIKFLVWCILLVLCWPLALFALVAYPLVWILLIPFRVAGIAVDAVLGMVRGIVMLPARMLRGPRAL